MQRGVRNSRENKRDGVVGGLRAMARMGPTWGQLWLATCERRHVGGGAYPPLTLALPQRGTADATHTGTRETSHAQAQQIT